MVRRGTPSARLLHAYKPTWRGTKPACAHLTRRLLQQHFCALKRSSSAAFRIFRCFLDSLPCEARDLRALTYEMKALTTAQHRFPAKSEGQLAGRGAMPWGKQQGTTKSCKFMTGHRKCSGENKPKGASKSECCMYECKMSDRFRA